MMLLLPFVLTILLSSTFGSMFSGDAQIQKGFYAMVYEDESQKEILNKVFKDISFINVEEMTLEEAEKKYESRSIQGYSLVQKNNIDFHANSGGAFTTKVMANIFEVYRDKADVIQELIKQNKTNLIPEVIGVEEYVQTKNIKSEKTNITSFDYFGVTMLSLILCWNAFSTQIIFDMDQKQKTLMRTKISPIKTYNIYFGKLMAAICQIVLQTLILMSANTWILDVNFGNYPLVFALALSLGILYASLGMMFASSNLNQTVSSTLVQLLMQISILFGGSYLPINDNMGFLTEVKKLSPVGWMNSGAHTLIETASTGPALEAISRNLILTAAFLVISFVLFRKKKVI